MEARWITPVVTALHEDGSVDLKGCGNVYRNLMDNGMDGILVLGSLGEFFALPAEAKRQIVRNAAATVKGKVQLIVGTTFMVLEESIEFANFALQAGADAVMAVPPYYFHMPDASIINFYDQLAAGIDGPLYMYNFPGVTGYDIKPEVVATVALRHENIVGIKDTVLDMAHTRSILGVLKDKRPGFEVYSGFDENFCHNLLSGGRGCIAGTSNFAPEVAAGFARAARSEDLAAIAKYQRRIDDLMPIYSIGAQFTPIVKKAMQLRGQLASDRCTAPLLPATDEEAADVRRLLERNGLLPA